jgi:hypothetical protein
MLMLIFQLLSYGLGLVCFAAIAFVAARFWGLLGMFAGHIVVALTVTFLDVRWVQAAMHAPNWDGTPDMDIVFTIGLLIRIMLINIILLPVTYIALRLRARSRTPSWQTETGTEA